MKIKTGFTFAAIALSLAACSASVGGLPFPQGYHVMPGDHARWAGMTTEQQQRALSFLSTGSTIESSLEAD